MLHFTAGTAKCAIRDPNPPGKNRDRRGLMSALAFSWLRPKVAPAWSSPYGWQAHSRFASFNKRRCAGRPLSLTCSGLSFQSSRSPAHASSLDDLPSAFPADRSHDQESRRWRIGRLRAMGKVSFQSCPEAAPFCRRHRFGRSRSGWRCSQPRTGCAAGRAFPPPGGRGSESPGAPRQRARALRSRPWRLRASSFPPRRVFLYQCDGIHKMRPDLAILPRAGSAPGRHGPAEPDLFL